MKLVIIPILIFLIASTHLCDSISKSKSKSKKAKTHSKLRKSKAKQTPSKTMSFNENSDLLKNTNLYDLAKEPEYNSVIDLSLGKGPIFGSGWVKFFKFNSDELEAGSKPRSFFKNTEFYAQARKFPKADISKKVDGQNVFIKSEAYFYFILFKDKINFLTSRTVLLYLNSNNSNKLMILF